MTTLSQALQNYTVESLDMDVYEISQLSEEEFQNTLRSLFENEFANLSIEEQAQKINDLTDEFTDALDDVEDYMQTLSGQIEESEESGALAQAHMDKLLLQNLQEFVTNSVLSNRTTEMLSFLDHLRNIIVETDQDEYFVYDTKPENRIYGGEIVKFNLTATLTDLMIGGTENAGDTNGDGIADTDVNEDGMIDAADMRNDDDLYDLSSQDLFLEFNKGDKILSSVWDESEQMLCLEVETSSRSITLNDGSETYLSPKTFMIEISIKDLAASHIFLEGENVFDSHTVFAGLPQDVQKIVYAGDSAEPIAKTLSPELYAPDLNEQLKALPGYEDVSDELQNSIEKMSAAFEDSSHSFELPSDASSTLQKLINTSFDVQLLNSYSETSVNEAVDSFFGLLDEYSEKEQAALMMTFVHTFVSGNKDKFAEIFSPYVSRIQNIINVYDDMDSGIGHVEKAIHTLIETTTGIGLYSGGGTYSIFDSDLAFSPEKGKSGDWENHQDNVKALELLQEMGFDYEGTYEEVIKREQGLIEGEISSTDGLSMMQTFTEILAPGSDIKYWKGGNLSQDEWNSAIRYLKNHLLTTDGELVDNPLQVFKDCMQKRFKDSNASDNFAAAFLYACDMNSTLNPLMFGPHGKDIVNYLWDFVENPKEANARDNISSFAMHASRYDFKYNPFTNRKNIDVADTLWRKVDEDYDKAHYYREAMDFRNKVLSEA